MSEPRHISRCVNEWLDGCPFNLPDVIVAIRDELATAEREAKTKREAAPVEQVLARHSTEATEMSA